MRAARFIRFQGLSEMLSPFASLSPFGRPRFVAGGAGYSAAVLADSPLAYWRMGEASGTTMVDSSGNSRSGTYAGGFTLGVTGGVTGDTAVSFNGSTGRASAALNLSALSAITIELWLKWTTFANNDALAAEFTANINLNNGAFIVDPNESSTGKFQFAQHGATGYNGSEFTRPSSGAWHYFACVMDLTQPGATQTVPYLDGAPVAYTKTNSAANSGTFASSTLNLMCRAGASLFGAGSLDEFAIYPSALSSARIAAHYAAA